MIRTLSRSLGPGVGFTAPLIWLAAISAALFGIRMIAAFTVGFGDSEALYACYAVHPQPGYLDHPGLIGLFARVIGGGTAPSPRVAHVVTASLATAVPWLAALVARASGAEWRGALLCGIAVATVPEMAVGLFAMTPDLLLSIAWFGALGSAAAGLAAPAGSVRAATLLLVAGLVAGISVTAKVSGLTLVLVLVVAYAARPSRAHARTPWPWLGVMLGLFAVLPVVVFEANHGFPMLRHRLIDTQEGAGLSLRNLAYVPLGQLVYLSPLFVIAAVVVARDLWKRRHDGDPVALLFGLSFLLPLAVLLPVCLWSRVSEPHWLAPAFLSLPLHFARSGGANVPRRFGIACAASGGAFALAVHAWVLIPGVTSLLPNQIEGKKIDIANELYGWPELIARLRLVTESEASPTYQPGDIIAIGPHWTVCAQLQAGLRAFIPVGCATPIPDDFDRWLPRARWVQADVLLFVTDDRFDVSAAQLFPDRVMVRVRKVPIERGGQVVRTFRIAVLKRAVEG